MCCPLLATCLLTGLRGCYCGSSCEGRGAAAVLKTENCKLPTRQHKHYADHRCKAQAYIQRRNAMHADHRCSGKSSSRKLLQKNFADHRCKASGYREPRPYARTTAAAENLHAKKNVPMVDKVYKDFLGMQLHPLYTCESPPTRTPFFFLLGAGWRFPPRLGYASLISRLIYAFLLHLHPAISITSIHI